MAFDELPLHDSPHVRGSAKPLQFLSPVDRELPWQFIPELLSSLGQAFEELIQENARLCNNAGQRTRPRPHRILTEVSAWGRDLDPDPRVLAQGAEDEWGVRNESAWSSEVSKNLGHKVSGHDHAGGAAAAELRYSETAGQAAPRPKCFCRTGGDDIVDLMQAQTNLETAGDAAGRSKVGSWGEVQPADGSSPTSSNDMLRIKHGRLYDIWDPTKAEQFPIKHHRSRGSGSMSPCPELREQCPRSRNGDELTGTGFLSRLVVRPNSRFAIAWDVVSMILLTVDILLSPMVVFGVDALEIIPSFTLFGALFWTIDLILNCFSGYYYHGVLELRPRKIFSRYIRREFILDVALVVNDWLFVMAGASTSFSRMLRFSKSARIVRLVRIIRLLRVIKLFSVWYAFKTVLRSQLLILSTKILRNISIIVMLNHFVACSWYSVAKYSRDQWGYEDWTSVLPPDKDVMPEPSIFYAYTTALHWALTQFTPASMEVHPLNPVERVFTIAVMLFSLLIFSSVVASMTATLTQTLNSNAEHVHQSALLQRFIEKHRVSVDLSSRIWGYINRERQRVEGRPVLESQVPLLKVLPEFIKQDLHTEVYRNVMDTHPLFAELAFMDVKGMMLVSHTAMLDEMYTAGSHVWQDGDRATKMYFVLRGDMHLFSVGTQSQRWGSMRKSTLFSDCGANDILCEHALWLWWCFEGSLCCITDVEVFTLDAAEFSSIMHEGPALQFLFKYAQLFRAQAEKSMSFVTDSMDCQEMVNSVVVEFADMGFEREAGLRKSPKSQKPSCISGWPKTP